MTRLSVNINKVALIRNARGSNLPNLVQVAKDCEQFGAHGITVHPRPDERHVRYSDIPALKKIVTTEFNIEGNPTPKFLEMVLATKPDQCTLVPDAPDALTSDNGWDTITHHDFLKEVIGSLKASGIRVSLFINPVREMLEGAKVVGADRVELYTGPYALEFAHDRKGAVQPYKEAGLIAQDLGLGINAGHDLNLDNLNYFVSHVDNVLEVSIGHALICDSLYLGLHNTIAQYRRALEFYN